MLHRLLTWLLPGTGARRAAAAAATTRPPLTAARPRPVHGAPRLPRSPYAREAAADHTVDVTHSPLTRPYCRAAEDRLLPA
ncbi:MULTISPECIES: hypothetical protein [Streptomyces]|uniref:hypothetical protein n=1 Tax=Streptomyces TaxID=1883 RepID=UPI00123B35C3|nr:MULTISPECIES: hypothetical protein [Streptomyces]NDZ98005.1 hypothetical protein [Streptomyces sp. SID10116]MYY86592.1 hypothetical protein [Streptomyces sp. SID335]MYZ18264.1 hypothetical protein [Streptomyces sp. SID337]NDZ92242.1 hypothetical protein [Streptomyces sp. SID10115]NEB44898.1 hypothetical protein [Streptomyces sp. SID339]